MALPYGDTGGDIFELTIIGFIVAVIAAVLLLGVAEQMAGREADA